MQNETNAENWVDEPGEVLPHAYSLEKLNRMQGWCYFFGLYARPNKVPSVSRQPVTSICIKATLSDAQRSLN